MERKELLKFAKIAAVTYDNPKDSRPKFKEQGYEIVEFFDIKDAQGYLLKGANEYVLSFRGTESKRDALADLKARMKTESSGANVSPTRTATSAERTCSSTGDSRPASSRSRTSPRRLSAASVPRGPGRSGGTPVPARAARPCTCPP